jgi:hypothetical protein
MIFDFENWLWKSVKSLIQKKYFLELIIEQKQSTLIQTKS